MSDIVKAEQFVTIVETAQSALIKNEQSVSGAVDFGQTILDTIEAEGMSNELDAKCNNYLVRVRETETVLKTRRNPVTQIFDTIRKEFTGLENLISKTNRKSVPAQIQVLRDAFATQKAKEQRQREIEAQRKLDIEKEKTRIAAEAEVKLSEYFNTHITKCKSLLYELFENVTLENFLDVAETIENYSLALNNEHYFKFTLRFFVNHISTDDANLIIKQALDTKHGYYAQLFSTEIEEYRVELLDKLPSKKTELEAIAEAEKEDAVEAQRLKDLREKREAEEKKRLENEAAEREANEAANAEAKKQESDMDSMFDNVEQTARPESKAQVRSGYNIAVTHPAGWVTIFQLWFEKEGKNLGVDVLGRKSLNQMKGWAEKHALKDGEKITSPYVKYEETFKTVAKA